MTSELTIDFFNGPVDLSFHPEREIALEIALAAAQAAMVDAKNGLLRALDYRAATPEGLAIKADVRAALEAIGYPASRWGYRSEAA